MDRHEQTWMEVFGQQINNNNGRREGMTKSEKKKKEQKGLCKGL